MTAEPQTIADRTQSYSSTPVVIDRPTDDLFSFIAACGELRCRYQDDFDAQVKQAVAELAERHIRHGRRGGMAALMRAARRQVEFQRRRQADAELAAMAPSGRRLERAHAFDDAELYRRRELALSLLLGQDGRDYGHLAPQVIADREEACRQQTALIQEQQQPARQLWTLRGLLGAVGQWYARQLGRDLIELDRQLQRVRAEIVWQEALLDAIQTIESNRAQFLAEHQPILLDGAAAVIVLTQRLLAGQPGGDRPLVSVDLDHPHGYDPLTHTSTGDVGVSSSGDGARVVSSGAARVAGAGSADPPRPR